MHISPVRDTAPTGREQAVGFSPPDYTFPLLQLELFVSLTYSSWHVVIPRLSIESQKHDRWCGVRGLYFRNGELGLVGMDVAGAICARCCHHVWFLQGG